MQSYRVHLVPPNMEIAHGPGGMARVLLLVRDDPSRLLITGVMHIRTALIRMFDFNLF